MLNIQEYGTASYLSHKARNYQRGHSKMMQHRENSTK